MTQILERLGEMFSLKSNKQSRTTDYTIYIMSLKEKIFYSILASCVIFIVAYIFYRSVILCFIAALLGILYPKYKVPEIIKSRQNELNLQFKDMLYSISSSISAGRSIEIAIREAKKDLALQYPDTNTFILKELDIIIARIDMNEPVELPLTDFGERSGVDDIANFAQVFNTCKRTGGNMIEVIKNTSNIIGDKIEIKQEIDTMLTQRKFEQKIMTIMPVGLILMLSYGAPDYMEPVFTTPMGKVAVTICIILLCISYVISKKIMDIKI